MVLGKGPVPTSVPVSAELQLDCMLASAQEDSYPSGLLPSIGPSSQRQGSLQNCLLLLPRHPSVSCESTPLGSSWRTTSEHSLEEIRCKLFLPGTCVAFNRFAAPWKKRLKHPWAAKQKWGPCPCSLELPKHRPEAVAGTETGKAWRPLSLFGAVPSWICHLITV